MTSVPAPVNGSIFREYINAKPISKLSDFPDDIINPEIQEFHLILGFASDDYDSATKKGKGNFSPSWNVSDFSPKDIHDLKTKHRNVKVVISIGGRGTDCPFNPISNRQWINNAKKSINNIIENDYNYKDYKDDCCCSDKTVIDGIDINYQYIDSDMFVECIGEIIDYVVKEKGLKVSISPTDAKTGVLLYYKNLYDHKENNIDWVNYQFYDRKVSTSNEFGDLYTSLSEFFSREKLLVGVSTDPNVPQEVEVFLEGCKKLLLFYSLPGIFVWNANDSKDFKPPYDVEKKAQELLLAPNK